MCWLHSQEIHDFLKGRIPFTDLQMVFQMTYDEFIAALNLMLVKLYNKKRDKGKEELKPFVEDCELVVRKMLKNVPGEINKS